MVHPWHKILLKFPFLRRVFGRVKVSFEQAAERGQDGLLYLPYSKLRVALADLGHGSADGDASAAPGNGGDQLLEGGQTPPSTAAAAAAGHAGHRGSTGGNPAGFVTDAQLRAIFNTSDLYHEQKLTFREFLVALALGYLLGYIGLGNGDDDGAELEDFGVAPYAAAGVAGADNVIADGVDGGTSPGQHKPASSSASSLARANSMSRVSESLRSRADSAQHMAAMLGHAPAGVLNAGGPGRASATSASRYHLLSASQQHMDGPTEGAASQPDAPLPDGHVHGGTTTAAAEHQPQTGSAGGAAPLEASPDAPSHHHGSGHRIVPLGGSAGGGTGAQGLGSSRRLAAAASASGVDGHPNNHGLFRHVSFTDGQALALEGDTASAAAIAREAAQQLHAETVAEESRTTAASSSITARSSFGRYTHGHPASTVDTANGAATTAAMMTAVGSSTPPTSSSDVTPRVTGGDANAEGSGLVHRTLSVGTSGAPKPILKSKSSNSMVLGAGQDDKAAMGAGSNLSSPSVPRAASGTLRFVEPAGVVTSAAGGEAEGSSPGDGSATWATAVAAPPHGSDNQHRHHNHSAGHIRFQGADADADDARGGFDGKQPDASGLPVAHHSSRGSGAYDSVGSDKDLEVTGTARVDVHVHHADGTVVPEAPLAAGGSGSSASTTSAADRLTHLARMRTNDIDRAGASGTGADIAFAFHLVLEAYIQLDASKSGAIRRDDLSAAMEEVVLMSPSTSAAAAPHLLRKPVKTADPERAGDSRASSSDSSHHSSHHSASGSQARPGAGRRRSGSPPPPGHDHQDHSGGSGGGSLLHKLSRGSIGGGSTGINGAGGGSSARDSRGASTSLEFVTSERFHELDWDEDGAVTFKEFLFAFVHWVGIDDTDEDNEAAEAERQRLHPHQHQHHHHAAHGHGHSHGSSGGAGSSPSATFHDGSAAAAAAHEAAGGRKHAHGGSSNPFASLMAAMTSKHGHAAAAGGHHATAAAVAEAQ